MNAKHREVVRISVLIVEDDPVARGYLRSALSALECGNVHEVSRADRIVSACELYRPHVAFLDIDLDGCNGIDMIKQLLQVRPGLHIVMVSAYSTLENVQRALAEGACGFIVKPFTMGKILEALDNAREGLLAAHGEVRRADQTDGDRSRELDDQKSV